MKIRFFILLILCIFFPCFTENAQCAVGVKAALLVNMDTGKILYERNMNTAVAPASLTKLMTMFLTMDSVKSGRIKINESVRISLQAAKIGGSVMHVNAGQKVPLVRLLAGTAVASGNDSATALAERVGGNIKNFVSLMNKKAIQLGMKNTRFKNPTGLPAAGQKTTAYDLWLLCRSYLKKHPDAARFHKMKYFMHKGGVTRNTNPLLGALPGVNGLKTGWTIASGYNLIVTAQKNRTRLIAIILGAPDKITRNNLAIKMIQAGYEFPNSPKNVNNIITHK